MAVVIRRLLHEGTWHLPYPVHWRAVREDTGLSCLFAAAALSGQGRKEAGELETGKQTRQLPRFSKLSLETSCSWETSCVQIRSQQPWGLDSYTPAQYLSLGKSHYGGKDLEGQSLLL